MQLMFLIGKFTMKGCIDVPVPLAGVSHGFLLELFFTKLPHRHGCFVAIRIYDTVFNVQIHASGLKCMQMYKDTYSFLVNTVIEIKKRNKLKTFIEIFTYCANYVKELRKCGKQNFLNFRFNSVAICIFKRKVLAILH